MKIKLLLFERTLKVIRNCKVKLKLIERMLHIYTRLRKLE